MSFSRISANLGLTACSVRVWDSCSRRVLSNCLGSLRSAGWPGFGLGTLWETLNYLVVALGFGRVWGLRA